MKPKWMAVTVLVLSIVTIGMGTANADVFTPANWDFNDQWVGAGQSASWHWDITPDFQIPPDTINSAVMTVYAHSVDAFGGLVAIEGTFQGVLNIDTGYWQWVGGWLPQYVDSNNSQTSFDLAELMGQGWSTGQRLDVTLYAWERLQLDYATFTLDFNDNNKAAAPVPEPCTMLLMGTGLAGLTLVRRFRKRS